MEKQTWGYALVMAIEHGLGKTKYGSMVGLVIAIVSTIFKKKENSR